MLTNSYYLGDLMLWGPCDTTAK